MQKRARASSPEPAKGAPTSHVPRTTLSDSRRVRHSLWRGDITIIPPPSYFGHNKKWRCSGSRRHAAHHPSQHCCCISLFSYTAFVFCVFPVIFPHGVDEPRRHLSPICGGKESAATFRVERDREKPLRSRPGGVNLCDKSPLCSTAHGNGSATCSRYHALHATLAGCNLRKVGLSGGTESSTTITPPGTASPCLR